MAADAGAAEKNGESSSTKQDAPSGTSTVGEGQSDSVKNAADDTNKPIDGSTKGETSALSTQDNTKQNDTKKDESGLNKKEPEKAQTEKPVIPPVPVISAPEKKAEKPKPKPMQAFPRVIPKLRECLSWNDFKNHHTDEHNYAIETLVAGDSLKLEIEEAALLYEDLQDFGHSGGWPSGYRRSFNRRNPKHKTVVDDGDEVWLQRVRINSRAVMMYLGRQSAAGKKWNGRPHVFKRPFRYLIHFHDQMKEALAELEEFASSAESKPTEGQPVQAPSAGKDKERSDSDTLGIDSLFNDADTLAEMRLYVKFMDEQVMPEYQRFQVEDMAIAPTKIRWDLLWYLFKPGDLVYVPNLNSGVRARIPTGWDGVFQRLQAEYGDGPMEPASSMAPSKQNTRASHTDQMVWRVYRPPYKQATLDGCSCDACAKTESTWAISCYHIDYDGQNYRAVERILEIPMYEGDREITQLACYPMRYVKQKDEIMERGRLYGAKFIEHIDPAKRYSFYRGWTLIKTPLGQSIEDKNGRTMTSPEHIESEILVDFEEAFNQDPSWKPEILETDPLTYKVVIAVDNESPLQEWHDSERTKLKDMWEDKVVTEDGVDILQMNKFIETDVMLKKKKDNDDEIGELDGDNLALLPRRLFAYALWERKFVQIDVRDVSFPELKDKDRAFDSLQVSSEHKTLIQSLVYSHFKKRVNEGSVEIATQDLIRGKGKGIVILLFGVPGVGKTATAEAVAQKFEKPLFPITCGDLGFTPESVESSLSEIFRLAHLWDCVLLLDEADVFITQRDRKDLERNALVSVFLRMLEYYNGILFLTTNRPGVLDEAVKSRVHLNLHYNFLTEEQVVAIFKLNIARLKEIEDQAAKAPGHKKLYIDEPDIIAFASDHWRNHTDGIGRWNGRQIRNAFLIAASLAHYEGDMGERPEGLQKQLTSKHFKKVEETTRRYDEYRVACLGDTDSYLAHDRYERDDEYSPVARGGGGANAYMSHGQHQPQAPGYLPRTGSFPWQKPVQAPPSMNPNSMQRQAAEGWSSSNGAARPPAPGYQQPPQQPSHGQPPQHQFSHAQGQMVNRPPSTSNSPNFAAQAPYNSAAGGPGGPQGYDMGGNVQMKAGGEPGMSDEWMGPGQQRWQQGQNGYSHY
ncbi:hypothetical protein BBK36DRAFT_1163220 [Trichoderma citrinoviride]|uniref:AAA+ ATPase domain-containing protein n=1 Tax=Trichoderma citrinoviride TaxID=58853 RepID=A0A2T4AYM1_9HYPO|nr:hypothetical protein BBK36DRAFT_1163220 [Trichoderma citrinoviride]PTB62175.1 hypothetical protein BBK36DRAFT_1163220 [Trichoderma citrinoviride]